MTLSPDPYPDYARSRAETPVYRAVLPNGLPAWIVTRYDDVRTVLADPGISKNPDHVRKAMAAGTVPEGGKTAPDMNHADPPDHTRLRRLVTREFTGKRIAGLEPRMREIAGELIGRFAGDGHADLIAQFAIPFPVTVICELLGVPEADRAELRELSVALLRDDEHRREAHAALTEHIRDLVRRKRNQRGDDLISALVPVAEDDDALNWDELASMVLLLLVAGHETTANLIGNGMLGLLRHPEQAERLRRRPELLSTAVDELLRFDPPLQLGTFRFATSAIELETTTIPEGSAVIVNLASANRDERYLPDADTLDVDRKITAHLSFGHGIHYCLGAQFARAEGRAAFGLLLRLPALRLAVPPETLEYQGNVIMRGLKALPVTFDVR
ncbi:cytochrome P450 [Amycolatopsis sp. NPDC059657]|uniref:cytochrome P450 family protein n=1 Tax=Amycolatopsis sp. NPDC059657 TaxID=3346899 RepID=UPI00366E6D17